MTERTLDGSAPGQARGSDTGAYTRFHTSGIAQHSETAMQGCFFANTLTALCLMMLRAAGGIASLRPSLHERRQDLPLQQHTTRSAAGAPREAEPIQDPRR